MNPKSNQPPNGAVEYSALFHRRFWWVLIPLFVCWSVVWALSWLLPPTYVSEALILVEQQKVPEHYVVSNVTVNLQDRLQSMTEQILSRTRLQGTIDRFHLYTSHNRLDRLTQAGDDPVERMRKDIQIDLVKAPDRAAELTAFKIQYSAGSRELAQQVNSELTSLFIDENLRAQQQLSESTTSFLNSQLKDARTKLEEQEATLRTFKMAHFGDLPSEMQSNVQILSGLQGQLQTIQRNLDSARQQKLYLESLVQQYQSQSVGTTNRESMVASADELEKELTDLRVKLAEAQSKYTDDYPDVIRLKESISKTQTLKENRESSAVAVQKDADTTKAAEPPPGTPLTSLTPTMMQIQGQLKSNELEIKDYEQQEKDIQSGVSSYQRRLNLTPQTEQQLADVSRGYEESMANYNSLLQKQMQSQLATNLEQRQQGEQFRILDPPSLPSKPSSPNHIKASLVGLILGAGIGIGLATFLELTRVRIWQANDLIGLVPGRLLVALPHLSTPREERFGWIGRWLKVAAATAMMILIVAGNIYTLFKG